MAQVTQEEIQAAFAKYAPVFNRSGAQGGMQGYIDEGLSKFRYYDPLQVEVHNKAVDDQRNAVSAYKSLQQYSSQIQDVYDEVVNASNEYTQKGSARGYQSSILSAQNKLRKILSGISDNQRVLEDTGYISDDVRKYIAQVQQAVQELDSSIGESYKILQDEADFESKPKALQLLETAWKGIKAGLSRAGTGTWEFLIGDSSGLALEQKRQREDYEAMQDFLAKNVYKDGSFRGTGASRSFGKTPREKILDIVHKNDEAFQAELQQLVSFADNKMLAEAISSLGYSLGYMIPTMVTAGLTGGVEAPASVLSGAPFSSGTALSAVAQSTVANPSFWATALPMYGNTYYEAKQEGATETEAQIAGLLNGFLGGVIETSGGIGALPTDKTGVLVGIIRDALAEGGEEVAQGIVENAVASAIYRAETPTFSMDNVQAVINPVRALKEFALGTVAGGLFGSAKAGIGAVASKAASGIQSRRAGTVTPLVNTAIQGVTEPESAYLAQGATQAQSVPRATGAVDIDIAQTAQINPEISQQVTNTAIDAGQTATPMELTEEQKAIKKAAERMGVRVEFDHTGVGEARIENGVIHISPDSANVRTLFVHELTHYLENSNRYFDLMNFVMDGEVFANWLGEGVTQAQYRDAIIRQYAEQGIQLDEAGANKEMLARFISENLFQNQNAIEQLAVKNRGLFDTIRNWIHRMVELFKGTPQERALRKIERMYKNALDGLNMQTVDSRPQYSISTLVEIAQMTEEQAGTTPRLQPETGTQTGDSISRFYESVQASSIFDDNLKSLAANDARIKYYESIANADTMNEANTELNNGGEKYVTDWFKKDPKTATPKDVATGFILMYRYQAIGDYESAVAVAQKLRNMGTNAGQTVQMFSILGRFTPDGMLMYAQKSLDEAFETMVKGRTQAWIDANKDKFKLTNEDIDFIRRRTWQAAQLPEGRDKRILLGEIAARIQNKIPPQKGQNIRALQRISLLLNPKTNVRNVLGNVTITPMHIVSDFFAAPIDKLISKKTGVRTTGLYDISSVKGFKKGFYESYDDFRRQINTRDIEANRFEIGEGKSFSESHKFKPLNALSKALNALDRTTTFLLDAGDRPFFEMWFINSLNNQMRLNNVTTPTAEMIEIARQDALSRTWQDTNNYTRSVSAIKKAMNHIRIPGLNYGLGDIVIKFVKTPANLTKAIVDFSPVGLVKALSVEAVRFTNAVKTGQVTPQMQRNFVRNLGNGIAGSLLYLIVHALVSSGKIELTGDESERDKETDFSRNVLGVQSYSVKIGDKYYSYDWAQPVAATLAIVADFMEGKETESDSSAYQRIKDAIDAGGKVLFDQSFMQSIKVLFEEDNPLRGIYKAILNEPAAFVPQLFSQFASLGDDTVRTSYVYGDDLQTLQNKIKAKIPGLRQQLEPVVDVLGRDVENKNNVFNAFFNPSNVNAMKETPEGSEMYRVYSVTGETGALPSTAPYYVMKNNKKTILTPEQRTQYQRITGQTAVNLVSNLLNNVQYQNLSYKEKADVLSRINSYSRALANKQVLDIEPSKEMKSVFEAEEAGIPMSEYLLYRAMIRGIEADKDKEGKPISGTKKSKILDVINSLNLTREQKDFLYLQQDYTEKEINQTPWHRQSSSSSTDWLYNFWGGVLGGN